MDTQLLDSRLRGNDKQLHSSLPACHSRAGGPGGSQKAAAKTAVIPAQAGEGCLTKAAPKITVILAKAGIQEYLTKAA
jgi:hypothetical protein